MAADKSEMDSQKQSTPKDKQETTDKQITPLILTFTNFRTPELQRAPTKDDPDGATLELWLKYEGTKKYRWRGRASMDAGKLAEALAGIKDESQVILRLQSQIIPKRSGAASDTAASPEISKPGYAELLLQVSNQRWTLPGVLCYESDDA